MRRRRQQRRHQILLFHSELADECQQLAARRLDQLSEHSRRGADGGQCLCRLRQRQARAIVGGTSCAAPLWAGFMALVNQQAAANGAAAGWFHQSRHLRPRRGRKLRQSVSMTSRPATTPGEQPKFVLCHERLRSLHRPGHARRDKSDQRPGRSDDPGGFAIVRSTASGPAGGPFSVTPQISCWPTRAVPRWPGR